MLNRESKISYSYTFRSQIARWMDAVIPGIPVPMTMCLIFALLVFRDNGDDYFALCMTCAQVSKCLGCLVK